MKTNEEIDARLEAELAELFAKAKDPRVGPETGKAASGKIVSVPEGYGDEHQPIDLLPPLEDVRLEDLEMELRRLEEQKRKPKKKHRFEVTRPPAARIQPQQIVAGEKQYRAPSNPSPRAVRFLCTPEELTPELITQLVSRWNLGVPLPAMRAWANERLLSSQRTMEYIDIYATISLAMTHEAAGKAPPNRETVHQKRKAPGEMSLESFRVFLRQWKGGESYEMCRRSVMPYENGYVTRHLFASLNQRYATIRREEELTRKRRAENPFAHPTLAEHCKRHVLDGKQYIVFPVERADDAMRASFRMMGIYGPPSIVNAPNPIPVRDIVLPSLPPPPEPEPSESLEILQDLSKRFYEMNDEPPPERPDRTVLPPEVHEPAVHHDYADLAPLLDPSDGEPVCDALPEDVADMDIEDLLGLDDHAQGTPENDRH